MLCTQLEHSRLSPSLLNFSIRENSELNEFIIGDVVKLGFAINFPFLSHKPWLT